MERLEEYKADRKSKSLEESKGGHLMRINPSTALLTETDSQSFSSVKWADQYRSLTEYDKKRDDSVKAYVDALRRLEERGILKHCGKINLCLN
jgi:hypothetical protein